jgi:folate-dependent phosphoribosylglycinamide formyltransferase PurN
LKKELVGFPNRFKKDKKEKDPQKIKRLRNSSIKRFCVHGWMMILFEEVVSWISQQV